MTLAVQESGQIRFVAASGFSPADIGTNYTRGTPADVLLTLSAIADDAGRQSSKADFGANRHLAYSCMAAVDFTGETPVQNTSVEFYWAPSISTTAANGNIAGNSGLDAAAGDGATVALDIDDFLAQCIPIGSLSIPDGIGVQAGFVGILYPPERYGQMVVVNRSGDAFEADNVEAHVVLNPIVQADV